MRENNSVLLLAAMLLFATSCLSDNIYQEDPPVVNDDAEINLRLQTPQGFQGQGTRSLTIAQENRIEDVFVFVFNSSNVLTHVRQGRELPTGTPLPAPEDGISGEGRFRVTLPASEPARLMVLANVGNILTTAQRTAHGFPNRNYADVIRAISATINSARLLETTGNTIPMWGEEVTLAPIVENVDRETIRLHRAVARIDVGIGQRTSSGHSHSWSGTDVNNVAIPFVLESVHVMRPSNRFAVVPAVNNRGAGNPMTHVTAPTILDSTTPLPLPAPQSPALTGFRFTPNRTENRGAVYQSIYVPEANIRMAGVGGALATGRPGDINHLNRMALIIGGNFNNTGTTYYRVDFASGGELIDVLRNHLYLISIMGVRGPGSNCPVEAYESLSINMDVEIHDWIPRSEEVIFDGINWIRLNHTRNELLSRHAILYDAVGTTDELHFETTIPLSEWDLSTIMEGFVSGGTIVSSGAGIAHTIQNDRFRVELICTGLSAEEATDGRDIHTGYFRFTSRMAYDNNPPPLHTATLTVEVGRIVGGSRAIRFPIYITQRDNNPNDWIQGPCTGVCLGDCNCP